MALRFRFSPEKGLGRYRVQGSGFNVSASFSASCRFTGGFMRCFSSGVRETFWEPLAAFLS